MTISKFNNYLTKEKKKKIINLYDEGYNTVEIAKQLNRNNSSIGRFLRKNSRFPYRSTTGILKKDIQTICDMYLSGVTAKEILKRNPHLNICEETVINIAKRNDVKIRPRGKQVNFKEDFFENIDCEEKAYYLGMFLADGNVCKPNGRENQKSYIIQIELMESDKYIIEKFKELIDSDNKIYKVSKGKSYNCHFMVNSRKMAGDLRKYGIFERKTFYTELCYCIPDYLMPHYIRGIFDGDGTVYFRHKDPKILRFGFYGTHKLMSQLRDYLFEKIGLTPNKVYDKETVSFTNNGKQEDIVSFYNYIYKDATIYLKRKKQKFDNYFQARNISI